MKGISTEVTLHQAVVAHREGELDKAERLYRDILQSHPTHPDANHNLGILLVAISKSELALPLLQTALDKNPKIEQFWLSYIRTLLTETKLDQAKITLEKGLNRGFSGDALKILGSLFGQKGMYAESLKVSEIAAQLMPEDSEVHNTLGASLKNCMQLQEAKKSLRKAITLNPEFVEAHYNLGCTLQMLGRLEDAERSLRKAMMLNSEFTAAHNSLGVILQELGRLKEAEETLKEVIAKKSDYADPHNNLGIVLSQAGRLQEAETCYKRAILLNYDFPEAHNNLGNVLKEQKKLDEAEASYMRAAEYNLPKAFNNLGLLFVFKKDFTKAKNYYQKALILNPSLIDAKYGLSLLHLMLKEFSAGFKLYEARYHPEITDSMAHPPDTFVPQYRGRNLSYDLQSKHLLICPEQGLGDEIMFASVLPELAFLEKKYPRTRITLACDPRLVDLFTRSFEFLTAIPKSKDNKYQNLENDLDYWMFIGSLPQFYRHKIEDFTCQPPYLLADKKLSHDWDCRFEKLPHKMNIGISWVGGKAKNNERSLSLEQMLPILSAANQRANIINLQYGDHRQEMRDFHEKTGITIFDWDDCDPLEDLNNYSAQIKALDLVISIDTSLVELAGALGTNTFVLLSFDQSWRWGEQSKKSYWHPNNMVLFRQTLAGDWDEVIQRVVDALG